MGLPDRRPIAVKKCANFYPTLINQGFGEVFSAQAAKLAKEFIEKCARSCAVVCKKLRTWLEALKYLGCRDLSRGSDGASAQEVAHFRSDLSALLADGKNTNKKWSMAI
ncbi:hypothetical protein LOY38_14850 [Pseudomonas sp. B21-015]|uniref:hypothetical protein n=1 Tax=Pseudomonas sp. B21-015 TaxID=2895473 RepID=UPI002160A767|nr:hypothetical protein [Pseudomonas sp. B21-015]UVM47727.1 hypothetical protein LOY38_14850 [Pseudomonas sp. B21-015]